jgi:hypothetical protein
MPFTYEYFKDRYLNTKPIRGRSADIRPIGMRRRDWERLEMDGEVVACVLYRTQVVRYYPDGRVGIRCDNWHTPSTAQFVQEWSPFSCNKTYNRLWVYASGIAYPVPHKDEIVFEMVEDKWVPTKPVVMHQRVVDRDAMKRAREPYKEFLQWGVAFLKMSDGWLMGTTSRELGICTTRPDANVLSLAANPDTYAHALFNMFWSAWSGYERRRYNFVNSSGETETEYDVRVKPTKFKDRLYGLITERARGSVFALREVKPGPKPITDVV